MTIESFKIRGGNSLKNNFNNKKLHRHLAYIDAQIVTYESMLEQADKEEDQQELESGIAERKDKREEYQEIQEQLNAGGEEQISTTNPDARAVVLHRNIVNVGYNIQSSSDEKHKLLVEYDTGGVNDSYALTHLAIEIRKFPDVEKIVVLVISNTHSNYINITPLWKSYCKLKRI